ncbi:hypothetical protein [Gluconacetobacter azotocaptans]|uniref:hypothetical protein n=1 Tax=Gluconacetobacter azotocaptans TaxID=142834 RepID=UPI001C8161EF|nr:hypothetical protein [Gluconacetobacter azotocaptans]GBQ32197.1 hypothetical protein AA13594_2299 [Gluconacetobacter azotocaptans DSM 13594]
MIGLRCAVARGWHAVQAFARGACAWVVLEYRVAWMDWELSQIDRERRSIDVAQDRLRERFDWLRARERRLDRRQRDWFGGS